jgi:hypothetical protein
MRLFVWKAKWKIIFDRQKRINFAGKKGRRKRKKWKLLKTILPLAFNL